MHTFYIRVVTMGVCISCRCCQRVGYGGQQKGWVRSPIKAIIGGLFWDGVLVVRKLIASLYVYVTVDIFV